MRITVIDRGGISHAIAAAEGSTLMHAIRDGGIDEVLALCGGFCSCATCHVYVAEAWAARVDGPGDDEAALLESSEHLTATSRLSCQIALANILDGLVVTIAPED